MNNRIVIRTEQILEAREQISSLKQQNDELKARIERLKSSLEWQVGAKEGINDNLSSISAYLDKQSSFLENATTLCNSVVSTTDETSNSLIAAISALMLSIIGISVVTSGNYRIITDPNGNVTVSVINTGTESTDVSVIPSTNQVSGNTKSYSNSSSVNYEKHDYSNYNVVSVYDESQVLDQHDQRWDKYLYTTYNKKYQNAGCTVTAAAMAYNMKHPDSPITPPQCNNGVGTSEKCKGNSYAWLPDKYPDNPNGTKPPYNDYVPGSKNATKEEQLQMIYNNINNNEPTVVRTKNHSVTAIGIANDANPDNLELKDILVVDPADGKVKTLQEVNRGLDTGAYLYTAK